ncbi:MAG TPA: pyridoxamine 5'-phosphate oxidase family protein [Candidatus Cybelea sp.]|nr:pyridoxamine 5'-phosphate oxidase family protein [Candidatus Cybelea sp.]
MSEQHDDPTHAVRSLVDSATRAYLGTLAERGEAGRGSVFPFVSLVLPGLDAGGRPLLLLSDLSDHAKNLKRDPHASLLYDGTAGLAEPLTGARVTLIGMIAAADDAENRRLYLARQPSAAAYAGFGDFHLYRFEIAEALLVAGFGRIHRLPGPAVMADIE